MDKDALQKALQRSKTEYLRKAAKQQEKAAANVVQNKLKEMEQGLIPSTLTEAEYLLKRADEVKTAEELLRVAQRRDHLATGNLDSLAHDEPRSYSTHNDSSDGQLGSAGSWDALTHPTVHPASTGSAGFVQLDESVIAERIAKKDYVIEKTYEELEQERVEAMSFVRSELEEKRRSLPIYAVRDELLSLIHKNQVIVIVGETGSGKTTQLLQYMYEDGLHLPASQRPKQPNPLTSSSDHGTETSTRPDLNGEVNAEEPQELRLICTQPRRIAAVSVAERVALEVGCRCGSIVGYKVRFDDKSSQNTRILFVTDGMMLKEFTSDPNLSSVAAIMIDEAHERSLSTDILLGLLRDIMRRNPLLKIIVASATINADKFSNFFGGAPVFTVSGRTFPVETYFSDEPIADYVTESAQTVIGLHLAKPLPGDILVFLPGQDTIEACAEAIRQYAVESDGHMRPLLILPIYSSLPPKEQARIYEKAPPGTRKVVIATNIAETSITIDGVVYVVDCGLCKQDFFNSRAGVEELRVVPTSQASAIQRSGRAGRTQSGECFRLYTAYTFRNELPPETIPEIMRCSMSAVVLQLKALGVNNLLQFDFVDPPSTDSLERALYHLVLLGAMKADGRLTKTGRRMAEFPMDPSLSRCLVQASRLGCGRHMAMAAAMLSLDSIFLNTRDPREKQHIESAKDHLFAFGNGDITGYVRLMEEWLRAGERAADFCKVNGINVRSMLRARDVLDQILRIYDRIDLAVDGAQGLDELVEAEKGDETLRDTKPSSIIDVDALTRCILTGYFFNVSKLQADKISYRLVHPLDTAVPQVVASFSRPGAYGGETEATAEIHPSSYLFKAGRAPQVAPRVGDPNDSSQRMGGSGVPPILRERPELVVFTQLRHTSKRFMMHLSALTSTETVLKMAPENYFQKEELESGLRKRPRS